MRIDWRTLPEGREKYSAYLASREWAVLKDAVQERSGGICEHCQINPGTQTHHQTYERIYEEWIGDLLHVCRDCHLYLSGKTHSFPGMKPRERSSRVVFFAGPCVIDEAGDGSQRLHMHRSAYAILLEIIEGHGIDPLDCTFTAFFEHKSRWTEEIRDAIEELNPEYLCFLGDDACRYLTDDESTRVRHHRDKAYKFDDTKTMFTHHPMNAFGDASTRFELSDDMKGLAYRLHCYKPKPNPES